MSWWFVAGLAVGFMLGLVMGALSAINRDNIRGRVRAGRAELKDWERP